MQKTYILILLWFLCGEGFASEIVKIGIFHKAALQSILISPTQGSYEVIADGTKLIVLEKMSGLKAENVNGKIQLLTLDKSLGIFKTVYLKRTVWGSAIRIKPGGAAAKDSQYQDNLIIAASGKSLKLINEVFIEHYISGVVESEAGSKQNLEYYKVQSIICRTYALANKRRHEGEEFNLCDKVHCQVYHGISIHNPDIQRATFATRGIVIVDSDINLITAGFHSNCGGQTVNSEDAWRYPVSYLKSVCDTFCTDMPHASWVHEISKDQWFSYLENTHHFSVNDTFYYDCAINYLPEKRNKYFSYLDSNITVTQIRNDLKLRSAYFQITESNDSIKFIGNGFGHGIGLCQEGAMKMANSGYSYSEILHYYYADVHLIDLVNIDFFRN